MRSRAFTRSSSRRRDGAERPAPRSPGRGWGRRCRSPPAGACGSSRGRRPCSPGQRSAPVPARAAACNRQGRSGFGIDVPEALPAPEAACLGVLLRGGLPRCPGVAPVWLVSGPAGGVGERSAPAVSRRTCRDDTPRRRAVSAADLPARRSSTTASASRGRATSEVGRESRWNVLATPPEYGLTALAGRSSCREPVGGRCRVSRVGHSAESRITTPVDTCDGRARVQPASQSGRFRAGQRERDTAFASSRTRLGTDGVPDVRRSRLHEPLPDIPDILTTRSDPDVVQARNTPASNVLFGSEESSSSLKFSSPFVLGGSPLTREGSFGSRGEDVRDVRTRC